MAREISLFEHKLASLTEELASGVLGPVAAHAILVGSWVAPPVILLGSSIASTWDALGPIGATLLGGTVTGGLVGGPESCLFRGGVCAALCAAALKADERRRILALGAAGTVSWLTYLVSVPAWKDQSGIFFALITKTLRGRDYYSACEVRGAIDAIQPGTFFACHPHGCLSAGWTWNLFWNPDFHKRSGCITFFVDPFLRTKNPWFRQVCDWYENESRKVASADKKSIKAAMLRGESLAIIPGGFEDATIMATGLERTAIRKRQGFVKYCLEEGYPITPVYTFGEAETYWTFSHLPRLRMWFNKYKIPMAIFFGRWWCPVLPRSGVKLLTYVGEPLMLPKVDALWAEHTHSHSLSRACSLFLLTYTITHTCALCAQGECSVGRRCGVLA